MAEEAWNVNHPVLTLLRQRRESGSTPGNRTDSAKLGLAIEGGGMRGVVSASMLTALDDLGFSNAIDEVYAASSGAINASYYLAGGTWYPLTIYFDDLSTPQFVSLRRAFTNKPILNLDYAFNEVLSDIKPLDYEAVVKSPIPLRVSVTLVDQFKTYVADSFDSVAELQEALRASTWLPVAIKGTTTFRGQRAVDGGVLTALPFRLAIEGSCTHILSMSTHPMGDSSGSISLLNKYTRRHLEHIKPGLGDRYIDALKTKYKDLNDFNAMRKESTYSKPSIFDIAPLPGTTDVARHELSSAKLMAAARNAYAVMYAALEGRPSSAVSDGRIKAIPRFGIAEKDDNDQRFIELVDFNTGSRTPWGITRTRKLDPRA